MSALEPLAGRIDAVVIGAAAGGIDALSVLLPALPATLGAAVFIVLHLPRERPSLLVEMFESAADVYADRLLGIILTGANEEGAQGLQAVHRAAPQRSRSTGA